MVREIRDESHFRSELSSAGNRLVVVDYTATWCGPCQHVAPHFEQFSKKYGNAVFLKVDVDKCQDIAAGQGVSAMPTFIFYRNKAEIDRLRGADVAGLEAKIQQHIGTAVDMFAGKGQTLGGGTPSASTVSQASKSEDNDANEKLANEKLNVDSTQPKTSIQFRLADGSRLTGAFNLTHTIDDIRSFIATARPQYAAKNFSLRTTFPNKELSDSQQTIQAAGIANAMIIHRLN